MSDVNRFVDAYHNGHVCRTYAATPTETPDVPVDELSSASSVDFNESTSEGWRVQAPECRHCHHAWHGVGCGRCDCATSCLNLCMAQSDEHIVRGEN